LNGPLEALAAAGGTLDGASLTSVRVRRLNGQEFTVDLQGAMSKGGSAASLPRLEYGDLVIVPVSQSRFAVLGSVEVPGIYPLPESHPTSLIEAVATARGADSKGARFRYVGIIRTEDGKSTRRVFDLGKFLKKGDATQNPEVHSGDVIFVPQSVGVTSQDLFRDMAELAAVAAFIVKG
jgi:protein involved in polysaccharide export with SLBB domain